MRTSIGTAARRANRLAIVMIFQAYSSLWPKGRTSVRAGLLSRFCGTESTLPPPFVNQRRHQSCPSGLVRGPQPCPVIAVVKLVKQDQVPPIRVFLELPRSAVHWPPALFVSRENANHPVRDSARHFGQVPQSGGIGRPGRRKLRPVSLPEFAQ